MNRFMIYLRQSLRMNFGTERIAGRINLKYIPENQKLKKKCCSCNHRRDKFQNYEMQLQYNPL